MLIEKPIKVGEIISIMLVTTQEIIAKLHHINADSSIEIIEPLNLNIAVDQTGTPVIQMLPMMVSAGDSKKAVTILRSHYIIMQLASEQAKNGYLRNTTGLDIPASSLRL